MEAIWNNPKIFKKKIRRIDFYSDNDITLQETIFSDIINELPQDSTAYDIYILKLLNNLFADLLSYKKFNTIRQTRLRKNKKLLLISGIVLWCNW